MKKIVGPYIVETRNNYKTRVACLTDQWKRKYLLSLLINIANNNSQYIIHKISTTSYDKLHDALMTQNTKICNNGFE